MKVLVLGNLGYVGSVLVPYLKQNFSSWRVSAYDSGFFTHCLLPEVYSPEKALNCQYYGDVRDFPEELLEGFDAVVYLAAISNDPMGKAFEEVTYQINQEAAIKIAELCVKKGVKSFVFASSCSVYGAAGSEARTEESEVNPLTAYAKSKVNTETALKPFAKDMSVTCLRFATACGWSPRLRLDLVLNDFVANALVNKEIKILSDGSPWRPLIHVKDMARAISWAVQRDKPDYLVVNAGSDEWNYQIKDLAMAVSEVLGGVNVDINTNAEPDKRSYRVSIAKFKEMAGDYYPVITLKEAIAELSEQLQKSDFSDKNFRNSNLIRLNCLSKAVESGELTKSLQSRYF